MVDCASPQSLQSQDSAKSHRIESVPAGLTARLLTISREFSRARHRTPADNARVLRARKAAEFSANLAAALGFSAPDLRRIREFYPFFYLPFMSPRARQRLPRRLRSELSALLDDGVVKGRRERALWPHIVELGRRVFSRIDRASSLCYPSIQIIASAGKPVRLHALTRLARERLADVPSALRDEGVTVGSPCFPAGNQRVLLLGHFDPHGFTMLVATYLALLARGLPEPDCILDYNATGDYGKFWKRTLPRAASEDYDRAVTVDLTVYWRHPERTLKGIRQVTDRGVSLTIVDHHFDTLFFVKDIVRAGAELVLTDIPGCFLGERVGRRELPFAWLGALGDRDLPMRWHAESSEKPASFPRQTPAALKELTSLMHALSPPPKEIRKLKPFPTMELVKGAADGLRGLKAALRSVVGTGYRVTLPEGDIWFRPRVTSGVQEASANGVETALLGRVLLVNQPLQAQGRLWYDILERVLDAEPKAVYALAGRYLPGMGFNFLMMKRWRELSAPASLSFLRARLRERAIGHFDAFWLNLRENAVAEITALIRRVNAYFGIKGLRNRPLIEHLLGRLVDARVQAAEQAADNSNQNEQVNKPGGMK